MTAVNESSTNFMEYAVVQRPEGKWRVKRVALIFLYIFVGVAWLVGVVGVLKLWPLGMFVPLVVWMLVFFTWRFVSVEHEYTMASGVISFAEIYGRRTRRQKAEFKIRELKKIAPMNRTYERDFDDPRIAIRYDFRGSAASPDSYFFLFTTESGKTGVVLFEATAKALKIFRFYNPAATVMSTTLRY